MILFRRADGTFVAEVNGLPYHVVQSDPLYRELAPFAAAAPLETVTPQPVVVPTTVRTLAMIRVLRSINLDGTPSTPGQPNAWTAFKAALEQQPEDVREDFNFSVTIDRNWPALVAGAEALCPPGQASAILDAVFIAAANQP